VIKGSELLPAAPGPHFGDMGVCGTVPKAVLDKMRSMSEAAPNAQND